MIIDRIRLCGPRAYLQDANNPGNFNLGPLAPVAARSSPLNKGQQWEIASLYFVIEGSDLTPLLDRASEPPQVPAPAAPLFSLTVQKEMFPGLFADPYRHRVHNVAGFGDFKRGTFENCQSLEVEGIATLVSIGTGDCKWVSPVFELPAATSFQKSAWELAASRKAPTRSFTYSINLRTWAPGVSPTAAPAITALATNAGPAAARAVNLQGVQNVGAFQLEFSAKIRSDAALEEKHVSIGRESIGRPLLRAINLLEPITCFNDFYTLDELLARSSDYHVVENPTGPPQKLWVCLDFSATLVHSPNQNAAASSSDYEFVEIAIPAAQFSGFQARLDAEELYKPRPV
jgi:hypothetical protein